MDHEAPRLRADIRSCIKVARVTCKREKNADTRSCVLGWSCPKSVGPMQSGALGRAEPQSLRGRRARRSQRYNESSGVADNGHQIRERRLWVADINKVDHIAITWTASMTSPRFADYRTAPLSNFKLFCGIWIFDVPSRLNTTVSSGFSRCVSAFWNACLV